MEAKTFWQRMNVCIWWIGAWINDRGWDWFHRFQGSRWQRYCRLYFRTGGGIQRLMERLYRTDRFPVFRGND